MNANEKAFLRRGSITAGTVVFYGEQGNQVRGMTSSDVRRSIDGPAIIYIVGESTAQYLEFVRPENEKLNHMNQWRKLPPDW